MLEFYFWFRFLPLRHHRYVILPLRLDDPRQSYDVISIFQDGATVSHFLLQILFFVTSLI